MRLKPKLFAFQKAEALRRIDEREATRQIGRSYDVSPVIISRLARKEIQV